MTVPVMGCRDNGGMTETTADNRSSHLEPEDVDAPRPDPLEEIADRLEHLADTDPAEAVATLAEITAELNRELDADTDRS